ncbi:MAG: NADH-quinone oxidoreductase subunit A [Phycisphaerales bacterium]
MAPTGEFHGVVLSQGAVDLANYAPIIILILMAVTFAVANIVLTLLLGPRRDGKVKSESYESGMVPIGTARKRFNVRFYIIAMTFLVFDVEVIFLYPWAATFSNIDTATDEGAVYLIRVLFFMLTTVIAYVYGFRKGVFRFD